jgi:hypothetical protein
VGGFDVMVARMHLQIHVGSLKQNARHVGILAVFNHR